MQAIAARTLAATSVDPDRRAIPLTRKLYRRRSSAGGAFIEKRSRDAADADYRDVANAVVRSGQTVKVKAMGREVCAIRTWEAPLAP